jgi:hypothetical protein
MLKGRRGDQEMIKAHVNEMGVVMRFDSRAENLSSGQWNSLLDELKSHYIPSLYQRGKRLYVDLNAQDGGMRAVVYFTPETVSMDEAIEILRKRGVEVFDVRDNPNGE